MLVASVALVALAVALGTPGGVPQLPIRARACGRSGPEALECRARGLRRLRGADRLCRAGFPGAPSDGSERADRLRRRAGRVVPARTLGSITSTTASIWSTSSGNGLHLAPPETLDAVRRALESEAAWLGELESVTDLARFNGLLAERLEQAFAEGAAPAGRGRSGGRSTGRSARRPEGVPGGARRLGAALDRPPFDPRAGRPQGRGAWRRLPRHP